MIVYFYSIYLAIEKCINKILLSRIKCNITN